MTTRESLKNQAYHYAISVYSQFPYPREWCEKIEEKCYANFEREWEVAVEALASETRTSVDYILNDPYLYEVQKLSVDSIYNVMQRIHDRWRAENQNFYDVMFAFEVKVLRRYINFNHQSEKVFYYTFDLIQPFLEKSCNPVGEKELLRKFKHESRFAICVPEIRAFEELMYDTFNQCAVEIRTGELNPSETSEMYNFMNKHNEYTANGRHLATWFN